MTDVKRLDMNYKNELNDIVSLHVDTHVFTYYFLFILGRLHNTLIIKKKKRKKRNCRRSVTNKSIFVARANIINLTLKIMYVNMMYVEL